MERLGRIEEISRDGRAIVRCSSLPDMGDAVYDGRQKRIGSVGRVFGPVDEPYASVTPEPGIDMSRLRDTDTFYRKRQQNGKNKRRNRGD